MVSGGTRRRLPSAAQLTSTPCSAHFFWISGHLSPMVIPIISPRTRGLYFFKPFAETLAFPAHVGKDLLDHTDGCKGCCTGKRAPGKGAAVLALFELEVLAGNESPHGKPARDPFCKRDDIGLHLRVLHGKPLPGTAHAGLHLVDDHEGAALVADLAYPFKETVGRDDDAGFALDRFDNDTGGIVVDDLSECVHDPRTRQRS